MQCSMNCCEQEVYARSLCRRHYSVKWRRGELPKVPPRRKYDLAALEQHGVRHLFLGTSADNVHDCLSKGRFARGERNGKSVLTSTSVLTIRSMRAEGQTLASIADFIGASPGAVQAVLDGTTWGHVHEQGDTEWTQSR